jgi:hypothetical protein
MTEHAHLTDAEVEAATFPLTQGAARIKFFRKLGCKVSPKPNGQPLVGRAEYEAALLSRKHRPMAPRVNVIPIDWNSGKGFAKRA